MLRAATEPRVLASCSDNEMTMTDLSVDARLLATERGAAPRINSAAVTFASALVVAGALALANYYTWRQGALFLLGAALGVVLYHALFGFTSAWRVFISNGRGAGLRAQMVMLAVAVLLFFPVLAQRSLFGQLGHWEYGVGGASSMGAGRSSLAESRLRSAISGRFIWLAGRGASHRPLRSGARKF